MKLLCRNCQHEDEPLEVKKGISCRNCQHPFDYFQTSLYNNDKNNKRLAEDRAKANGALVRGLKGRKK